MDLVTLSVVDSDFQLVKSRCGPLRKLCVRFYFPFFFFFIFLVMVLFLTLTLNM